MSRIGKAFKSFINPRVPSLEFERNFLTVLKNAGFNQTETKQFLDEGYNANTYVYSIINRIAETAASIPILVESINSAGEIEIIKEGDFYDFVHNPNPQTNYKSFTYQSLVYQLATGNEFHYGVKGVGSNHFTERYNLAPQYITPKVKEVLTGPQATSYKYNYNGTDYNLDIEEVMHLSKFNPDPASSNPVMGLSPLAAAYRTLVASNETITADASLIKNKGAFGILSSKGDRAITTDEAKEFDKAMKSKIGGGAKYGSFPITNGNFDFIKLAMSPQDLQILENGVMKLRDLCSVYGVSSRMFNDPNGVALNNVKEDSKRFYLQGVLPPLENELDHFNKFFVPSWNDRDNTRYRVRVNRDSIEPLQVDQDVEMLKSERKSKIIISILSGISEGKWTKESAIIQLMDTLHIDEQMAINLVGETPETNINTNE